MCDEDKPSSCAWPLIKGASSRAGLLQASAISGVYRQYQYAVQEQQGGRYVRSISSIHLLNQSSLSTGKIRCNNAAYCW